MNLSSIIQLMRTAIITIITVASPVLIVAMGVGLIVSIFQATTSIQDQTLTFVPKILAILGVLAALFGWMVTRLTTFTILLFERIPDLVK